MHSCPETALSSSSAVPVISVSTPTLVMEAGRAERQYWADLWRYRKLFMVLTTMRIRGWQALVVCLLELVAQTPEHPHALERLL